ncbi:flagellar biosynthesis protein FlhB [Phenylobacterium parvum]|uniref:Flagellar biosynthetic protein FlhB n=1 Tax=Phenylobacterium parvum TaxID=2201350 RepID=A0A2Z3HUF3_9CAUL|nr:flagellar biosynthesis protein FlhB [Phenylobacterium parvum]AWM77796.1 flagellar biosynthesis protein FlhB [Phenylobacterium parvum]
MAEENDSASKTEEPTGRRLEQAREKGDVPKTLDLPQVAVFAAVAGVLAFAGGLLSHQLLLALTPLVESPHEIDLTPAGTIGLGWEVAGSVAPILLAVTGAAIVAGVLGHVLQTGLMWSPQLLKFEFSKVSPINGFKRLFGVDALIMFAKSFLKLGCVAVIGYAVLRPHWAQMQQLPAVDVLALMPLSMDILKNLAFLVAAFLVAVAAVDWIIQRQRFLGRQRMTREEVKEEFKQTDGDPHVKARQRAIRIQRSRQRMMTAVPNATVVIMNPTHYAVALSYEEGEASAPTCVAKGLDSLALRIRAVAEEAGVPVIEDPPLARALYAAVEIDEEIPIAQYEAVAKVIGFVLANRRRFSFAR